MAWTEKLSSGRYRGRYRDLEGKRRATDLTYPHKAAALKAAVAAEEKARRRHGIDLDGAKRPWGEWATEAWWPVRDVAARTLSSDRSRLECHLLPRWGSVPIGNIRKADVRDWIVTLKKAGVGEVTVTRIVHLLSASMAYAVEQDIVDVNPCHGIKLQASGRAMERFLTRDEFAAIVAQLPTEEDKLVALMLATTGLRWGELAGLHWQRVDLSAGLVVVAETLPANATAIKPFPKSEKPRAVPLMPATRIALSARADAAAETSCGLEHAPGGVACRSSLVFRAEKGGPLRNSHWNVTWGAAVKASGVEGSVRIHDLRHTYASWLLQAGRPIAEVSKLLGHGSIVTTERYAHLAETPMDEIVAALSGQVPAARPAPVLEVGA